jgi:hypothetical protein
VVADNHFRTPPQAQLIGLPGGCLVAGVAGDDTSARRAQALRSNLRRRKAPTPPPPADAADPPCDSRPPV